ncbi:MAG: hypothetical protein ACQERB_08215 [Promethearchaeati archaeon]
MAFQSKTKYSCQRKKILTVLNSYNPEEKCSICGTPLYSARLESWLDDILVDFKINNGFCEKCALFEYESIDKAEIIFQDERLKKIYSKEIDCFT